MAPRIGEHIMKISFPIRKHPFAKRVCLMRVRWGNSKLSLGLVPMLFHIHRESGHFIASVTGVRVHMAW